MSSSYVFFVEANINGIWRCINSQVPEFYRGGAREFLGDVKYHLMDTFWNGSRSYFSQAFEKFVELGRELTFSDLSKELKDRYSVYVEEEKVSGNIYFRPVSVDADVLFSYVDEKKYDHHGLIHKDKIFDYEHCELDELVETDSKKLKELSKKELSAYEYYEWDDKFNWNWGLKELKRNAVLDITRFESMNSIFDEKINYRIIGIGC